MTMSVKFVHVVGLQWV